MKAKEISEQAGIQSRTLRFYVEEGLLTPRTERRNGRDYREYSEADLRQLKAVVPLRKAGFTLEEIRGLLLRGTPAEDIYPAYLQRLTAQAEEAVRQLEAAQVVSPTGLDGFALARALEAGTHSLALPEVDREPHFHYLDAMDTPPSPRKILDQMLLLDKKPLLWPFFKSQSMKFMDDTKSDFQAEESLPVRKEPRRDPRWLRPIQGLATATTFVSLAVGIFYGFSWRFCWPAWLAFAIGGGVWGLITYLKWRWDIP